MTTQFSLPYDIEQQLASAYRRMDEEARCRPAAPSDGFGNITVPIEELNLDAEAADYARHWWEQEEQDTFFIGCCNYSTRPATVYAIEAARALCGANNDLARDLLQIAIDELDAPLEEDDE
jgi:hypothetical protein